MPAFYDKWLRYYFNMNFDFSKKISAWIRFAQTIYAARKNGRIGAGRECQQQTNRSANSIQVHIVNN